jgi:hypothetical protein
MALFNQNNQIFEVSNLPLKQEKWQRKVKINFCRLVNQRVEVLNLPLQHDKMAEKDELRFGRFVNQTNQKGKTSN